MKRTFLQSSAFLVVAVCLVLAGFETIGSGSRSFAHARSGAVQGQPAAGQQNPCDAPANEIVAENCKPGNPPEEWDINGAGDPSIQGFATDISVNVGETVAFKIKTHSPRYRLDIYRLGYYGGLGARKVTTMRPAVSLPQAQPECAYDPATRLFDCGTWKVSASWQVPADAVSGIYVARLVREDDEPGTWRADNSLHARTGNFLLYGPQSPPTPEPHAYGANGLGKLANAIKEPRASHIVFVVRDDRGQSDILFQTSDIAWEAYNRYGGGYDTGSNTYGSSVRGSRVPGRYVLRAYEVSYNRPLTNRDTTITNQVFNAEYPMVRWLERNGYDVSYFAGLDTHRRGEELKEHKLFITAGHDEYWSGQQRRHVEAARDAGVNLAFFTGNDLFWKVRFRESIDGANTPSRTLVCYKENHTLAKIDPMKDVWTGTWRTSAAYNPEGPNPENGLTGTIFTVNAFRADPMVLTADIANLRFWRNTAVAELQPGETLVTLEILGHEWNEDLDNGFRPAGLIRLAETTVNGVSYPQDFGTVYDSGTATHSPTLYRAPSGALVFSAATVQWSWGLDGHHDNSTMLPANMTNRYSIRLDHDPMAPDRIIQQATVNLFADMGVQPTTLEPGLVPAEQTNDALAPVAQITFPVDGSHVASSVITITGTASDTSGGVVGGVEVSVDGGKRWRRAEGREQWRYEWTVPVDVTSATILSRAADDSGNLQTPGRGVTITIGRPPVPSP